MGKGGTDENKGMERIQKEGREREGKGSERRGGGLALKTGCLDSPMT